jgi:hypothetical protein
MATSGEDESKKGSKKKCRACSKNSEVLKDVLGQIHDEVIEPKNNLLHVTDCHNLYSLLAM